MSFFLDPVTFISNCLLTGIMNGPILNKSEFIYHWKTVNMLFMNYVEFSFPQNQWKMNIYLLFAIKLVEN